MISFVTGIITIIAISIGVPMLAEKSSNPCAAHDRLASRVGEPVVGWLLNSSAADGGMANPAIMMTCTVKYWTMLSHGSRSS